jgi:DNA invertase Pin-like site-specific DNA recombinase
MIKRSRRPEGLQRGVPTLGYATATRDPALQGPEIEAQRNEIQTACDGLGLELLELIHDPEPTADEHERPGLSDALGRIDAGEASCLVVSELERLSRRVPELAATLDRIERARARLIAVDVGLDTATPSGRVAVTPATYTQEPTEPADAVVEPKTAPVAQRALGYASVGQEDDGDLLVKQTRAIGGRAGKLGCELVEVVREREPKAGRALDRAGLSHVIERLAAGDASCLVVSGLERLSRSVAELGTIVQWLEENDVRLVAVELDLDTASPGGHATARALASVGGWERKRLADRTRKGLAAARAKRRAASGPGAPDWEAIRTRIAEMRAEGMTLQAIADVLNEERVPTQRGGAKWRPSSVQTAAGYKRPAGGSKRTRDLPAAARRSSKDPGSKPAPE